jgi:four helix bundle protein
VRFLLIAKGSLSELRTQLEIAQGIGYLAQRVFEDFENQCGKLGAMLTKLIKSRKDN